MADELWGGGARTNGGAHLVPVPSPPDVPGARSDAGPDGAPAAQRRRGLGLRAPGRTGGPELEVLPDFALASVSEGAVASPATAPDGSDDHDDRAAAIERPLPSGAALVRLGVREIGVGTLDALKRFLPARLRTLGNRRLSAVLLLVALVVVAVVAVAGSELASSLRGPVSVVVAPAEPAVIDNSPGGVGTISSAPQNVAVVSLNVQGVTAPIEVTAVDVIAGEEVTAGEPLLQLNPAPFEQNQQQILATLAQAQQALSSATAEASKGGTALASGQAYLSVQIPILQGQVNVDQQLAQIAEGNSTSLTAPISGSVSYVRVAPGQVVNIGSSLIQIIDPSRVDVSAGMQLSDLQSLSPGDPATVTPTQLPGVKLHGKVVAVSASAANGGLEGTVVISASNLADHPIPIGTQAFVNVAAPVRAAVTVPSVAVLNAELSPTVAVLRDHRVYFRTVQIGASDTRRTQILAGLKPGDSVAISNLQGLTDGDQVRTSSGSP